MKKTIPTLTIIGAVALLAACGNKTDANEKNFGAAMNQYGYMHSEVGNR